MEVTDTGIGIRQESLPRLFEPFTQAENATTRKYGGTGLGLAISRQIVTALGGELTVAQHARRGEHVHRHDSHGGHFRGETAPIPGGGHLRG